MMHDIPGDTMKNMGGPYNSKEEAEASPVARTLTIYEKDGILP